MDELARRIGKAKMKVIFVDDLMGGEIEGHNQEQLNEWGRVDTQYGIKFNAGKSKYMVERRMKKREKAGLVLGEMNWRSGSEESK